MKNIEGTGKS